MKGPKPFLMEFFFFLTAQPPFRASVTNLTKIQVKPTLLFVDLNNSCWLMERLKDRHINVYNGPSSRTQTLKKSAILSYS